MSTMTTVVCGDDQRREERQHGELIAQLALLNLTLTVMVTKDMGSRAQRDFLKQYTELAETYS